MSGYRPAQPYPPYQYQPGPGYPQQTYGGYSPPQQYSPPMAQYSPPHAQYTQYSPQQHQQQQYFQQQPAQAAQAGQVPQIPQSYTQQNGYHAVPHSPPAFHQQPHAYPHQPAMYPRPSTTTAPPKEKRSGCLKCLDD